MVINVVHTLKNQLVAATNVLIANFYGPVDKFLSSFNKE